MQHILKFTNTDYFYCSLIKHFGSLFFSNSCMIKIRRWSTHSLFFFANSTDVSIFCSCSSIESLSFIQLRNLIFIRHPQVHPFVLLTIPLFRPKRRPIMVALSVQSIIFFPVYFPLLAIMSNEHE